MRANPVARPHPSRRAYARSSSKNVSRMRAPQDKDEHRLRHSSRCQTAHLVPAPALLRPGFASLLRLPPVRGGRSAERRSGVCETPVGHAMTRRVRRLRGALRPMTRDARLSALHRGGFGLPGPRFSVTATRLDSRFGGHPAPSQRAPRSQVIVPDGRGPGPPGASGYKPRRRTPLPAPPSGCLRTTPLKERGCESCSINAKCSQ
jgi:hypothetical protein